VTLFFSNGNISPTEEYQKRLDAVRMLAERLAVPLVVDATDHADWLADVATGFEAEPEKGKRCARCFRHSLLRTHQEMERQGFDAFTTSLTVSPHKPTPLIFEVGQAIDNARFLVVDFKKNDGFKHSVQLATEIGLYRQSYCGCEFSG
jgi:predicted adenine nucleotide alpha hydrolase (AANH) superfamily ATPase